MVLKGKTAQPDRLQHESSAFFGGFDVYWPYIALLLQFCGDLYRASEQVMDLLHICNPVYTNQTDSDHGLVTISTLNLLVRSAPSM